MNIAFLGLGNMGRPMARNLLGLGHAVTVWNRTPGKAKALVAAGAKEVASLPEAVKGAEVVITMLPDSAAVAAVVHGPAGLLQHMPPRSIHLCMGTIAVETSAVLASAHAKAGQGFVAAPVFGRVDAVASRQIWIMAGGPESQVNRCLPIFVALGRGLTRVGPKAPLAHALKLGGEALTSAMEKAMAEILSSCEKVGLAPADYLRYLNMEIFKSPLADAFGGILVQPPIDPADLSLDVAANELFIDHQLSKGAGETTQAGKERSARHKAPANRGWREQPFPRPELTQQAAAPPVATPTPERLPDLTPSALPPPAPPLPPAGPTGPHPVAAEPEVEPPRISPVLPDDAAPPAGPALPAQAPAAPAPAAVLPPSAYAAMDGQVPVVLQLSDTSHFELVGGQVRAWSQGKPYGTSWRSLDAVERAFREVLFLGIQRDILLRPEATLDLRSTFGGGAMARVGESLELPVKRSAVPRLRELLGI